MPSLGRGEPAITNGPKSKRYVRIAGQPDATTESRRPHRSSAAIPGAWMKCVDTVSLGNVARSTIRTL